ncbi:carboxymuconolactone decarboxylase family protein [Neisseriaceae bacterium TC5R-5]|nr:carboxymuconolactone decarboxylase family protein [Neisseriaceae bacterium TC5R-5]
MSKRFDITPAAYQAMYTVHNYVQECGLDLGLLELLRLRISQINGCAFCIAMHIPLALKHGVSADKVNLVAAWKEAGVYSEREMAALAWAEAITVIQHQEVADDVYLRAKQVFSDKELSDLAYAIAEINAWNRLMLASRTAPKLEQ